MEMVTKNYIEREYAQALREFKCAAAEDEQWQARKSMAKLEQIAMQEFGFEYCDLMKQRIQGSMIEERG